MIRINYKCHDCEVLKHIIYNNYDFLILYNIKYF